MNQKRGNVAVECAFINYEAKAMKKRVFRSLVLAAICAAFALCASSDIEEWHRLKGLFDYDRGIDLRVVATEHKDSNLATVSHIEFSSTNGVRVPALLAIPKTGDPPFPCVIVQHGYSGSKDNFFPSMFDLIAMQGYAAIAIDAQWHGERKEEGKDIFSKDLEADREAIIQTVIDIRRAIDFLETRQEIEKRRIGYIGISMGAILGTLATAVEPRIDTCVLIVGGGDWPTLVAKSALAPAQQLRKAGVLDDAHSRSLLADIEPLSFAPHIAPRPALMLNGRKDKIIPKECAEKLYEALKDPKKIIWYDQGHNLTDPRIPFEVNKWMAETLKARFDPNSPET
jgi:cephalosporin-C deacetylase-like acetyl esterase